MAKKSQQLVTIEDFSVTNLSDFQGKKEEQEQIVKDNPFIEITDNETFVRAKKNRTALVTARTTLDKEKKAVAKRIKTIITDPVAQAYDDLIAITMPHENKQQEEVKRYETAKEEERRRKEREEQERINAILYKIDLIVHIVTNEINSLSYDQSLTYNINPIYEGKEVNEEDFEEYASKYSSEIESLKFLLQQRKSILENEEKNRLEAIELEKQRSEQERIDNIKQNIFNYQSFWNNKIHNLTEQTIEETVSEFNNANAVDCQEFQNEFAEVKEQIELSLNNRIAQIYQNAELEKQRVENLKLQRRGILVSLGFDYNTLVFVQENFSFKFDEKDLTLAEHQFNQIIQEFKDKLFLFKNPQPKQEETPKQTLEPKEPKIVLSANQKKSIDFINKFIQFQQQSPDQPINVTIQQFVLKNVK